MANSPAATARAFYSALEAGKQGPELAAFLTEDTVTTEHPNLVKPRGGIAGREKMLAASSAGASLLSKQTFAVRSAIEMGDLAVVRLTWTGVIARTVGPFHEGQVLTAHIAQFIETRDGRIASIETYDCYEPLE